MDPYTATVNLITEGLKAFQLVYNDIPEAQRQQSWADFFAWVNKLHDSVAGLAPKPKA